MNKKRKILNLVLARIIVLIFSIICLSNLSTILVNASTTESTFSSAKLYKITSKRSRKLLEVKSSSTENGARIVQNSSTEKKNQTWYFEKTEENYYKIVSFNSGKVIEIKDGATENGSVIQQNEDNGSDYQLWYFVKDEDGNYTIKSKANDKCLDITGKSTSDGATIQLWKDVNGNNQKWIIEEVENNISAVVNNASYKVINKRSDKALEVPSSSKSSGVQLQQYQYKQKTSQQWTFVNVDGYYYKIIANHSGKAIEVKNSSSSNGAVIQQATFKNKDNQLWYLEATKDGYYKIKSKLNDKCLDIVGISKDNKAKVQLWKDVDGNNQKWNIEMVNGDLDEDNDGLTNEMEWTYGTDINNADTDNDGLTDYFEVYFTGTDPLLVDTDNNCVNDGDEDLDNDTLTNIKEQENNGSPKKSDTDGDGLTDSEELSYGTKLDCIDTDNDKLNDYLEVKLGTNPLLNDTNQNGVLDGDEKYNYTLGVTGDNLDENLEPVLNIDLLGNQIDSLKIDKVSGEDFYLSKDIPGYVGCGYEFSVDGTFDSASLTFKVNSQIMSDPDFYPAIYYVDDENQEMILLENQVIDIDNCTVTVPLQHFSKYILLNKNDFDEAWNVTIKAEEDTNKPLDIAFVLDSSGSMGWNDPNEIRKTTTTKFINKLREDDMASIIEFNNYANVLSSFTSNKAKLISAVSLVDAYGGTSMYNGINSAFTQFNNQPTTREASKYMIVLSDGLDNYSYDYSSIISTAANKNIEIYTVGLGSGVNTTLLASIANGTGGAYYQAANANELIELFEKIMEEVVDISKDSDGDGISDYHEKNMRFFNGVSCMGQLNPNKADTDGDSISDGDEIGNFVYSDDKKTIKYAKIKSHPLLKDSDNDSLNDDEDETPLKAHDKLFVKGSDINKVPQCPGIDQLEVDSNKVYNTKNVTFSNFGSYCSILARAKATTLGVVKYPQAGLALDHFLSNTGRDYSINAKNMVNDTKGGTNNFNKNVNNLLSNIEKMVKDKKSIIVETSKPIATATFSIDGAQGSDDDFDWWYTIGNASGGMVAQVTRNGDSYTMTLNYHVQDFYDWEEGSQAKGGFVEDGEMYELHTIGWAKQFRVNGLYKSTITWNKGDRLNDSGTSNVKVKAER